MLTTVHLADPDFAAAARELLTNTRRLILAGFLGEARHLLDLLLTPGPWRLKGHGMLTTEVEDLMPRVCFLMRTGSPKVGKQAAMSEVEVESWADEDASHRLDMLKMPVRNQPRPAGIGWSMETLNRLTRTARTGSEAFNEFLLDAEFVLKKRLLDSAPPVRPVPSIDTLLEYAMSDDDGFELDGLTLADILGAGAPIMVSDDAQAIPTGAVSDVVAACLARTGDPGNYVTDFLFLAVAVLGLRQGRESDTINSLSRLCVSELGLPQAVGMTTWVPLADLIRSGKTSVVGDVDACAVQAYMRALGSRQPEPPKRPRKGPLRGPIASPAAVRKALNNTALGDREWVELPVLDTLDRAFGAEVGSAEAVTCWRIARSLVEQTGHWPVVTVCWERDGRTLRKVLENADLFSRFFYEEVPDADDVSPRALIDAADTVDVDAFIRRKAKQHDADASLADYLECEIEATRVRHGRAPSREEIAQATLNGAPLATLYDLDRWLLAWEEANCPDADPAAGRLDWFESDPLVLLLLPTPSPWEVLAYLNFFGTSDFGSEHYIALGRRWHAKFGAELYAHFGTMLQAFVMRPPATLEEAWTLAREHDLVAPSTLALPGIPLRGYARGLLNCDRWFLHERP